METDKKDEEKNINEIKKIYLDYSKKFNLPEINLLMEDFDIVKFLDKDSEFLLRDIRRGMGEKITAYLHLFETFVNPSSPPVFVFSFLKNLSQKEKEMIRSIYKELTRLQIQAMKLDTIYDEEKESQYISHAAKKWIELKKEIFDLISLFEKEFEKNVEEKEKSYFG